MVPEFKRQVFKHFPMRFYKALKVYAAMNDMPRMETALYKILENDIILQRILLQIRDNSKAEEIKRVSKEQVMREVNQINQGGSNVR